MLFYASDVSEKEKIGIACSVGEGGLNDSMSLPFPDCTQTA